MAEIKSDRDNVFDIVKGISILLVVLGHTYNNITHNFIYLFHVAIFFIISGYFFNPSYLESKEKFLVLIKKRILSLWVPYVSYNFVALLFQNIFLKIGFLTTDLEAYNSLGCFLPDGYNTYVNVKSAIIYILKSFCFMNSRPFAGGLWFLGGLFFVTFFYSFIQIILNKIKCGKFHFVFSLIFLMMGYLFEYLHLPNKIGLFKQIDIILISEIMFELGVLIKNYSLVNQYKKLRVNIKLIIFIISLISLVLFSHLGTISIASRSIINPIFYVFVSILGFIFTLNLSIGINKMYLLRNIFIYCGKHTIPILALHTLSFKLVTLVQCKVYVADSIVLSAYPVWKNNITWSILYLIIGMIIPIVISFAFGKIKILKKLFIL